MYILDKVSYPGWTLEAEEIGCILQFLEPSVCNHCKMTKQDYVTFLDSYWAKSDHTTNLLYDEQYEPSDFFPDNYSEMTIKDKIYTLLQTPCGAEFCFEIQDELNQYWDDHVNKYEKLLASKAFNENASEEQKQTYAYALEYCREQRRKYTK